MNINDQILVIFLAFFLTFVYIRCFFNGIKRYQLNNSAYKKRKKGETFKEWLLYSRYREEIPKILLVAYFSMILINILGLIICVIIYIVKAPQKIGDITARVVCYSDVTLVTITTLLFWSPSGDDAYERWITKRRGQNKKRK